MGIMKTLTINGVKYDVTPVVPATSVTLLANAWVGSGCTYSQVVAVPGATPNTKVDLQPTAEQLEEFHYKILSFVAENEGGVVTVYCIGDKPKGDHTIQTTLTEVEASGKIRGNTVGTSMPKPDWNQTDPTKADYILNKPVVVKSVNGLVPDEHGNVVVQGGGNSGGVVVETDPTVPAWAKQPNKPTYTASEVGALPASTAIPTVPTKVSAFDNDKGYLTEYTETDPTVPSWAKASTKPSYTKSEVGLGNVDNVKQYSASNPPPYPVTSVNGKTGAVSLDASAVGARPSTWMPSASDVGALPASTTIPTKVSQLTNDSGFIKSYTETDPTVPSWAKASTKPSYSKSEVGLGNVDNVKQYSASNPPPYPVTSVNGKTGAVTIDVAQDKIEILLPSEIVAVVGVEFNIYYKSIIRANRALDNFEIKCSLSDTSVDYKLYKECFRLTAVDANVGSYTLTVQVKDIISGSVKAEKAVAFHIIKNRALNNKNVLYLGDSLTFSRGGLYPAEIQYNLSGGKLISIGSQTGTAESNGIGEVKHEGYNGATVGGFLSANVTSGNVNKFYNPSTGQFDLSYFMTKQGYTQLDAVCLNLGHNNLGNHVNAVSGLQTIVSKIHEYNADIPVIISLIEPLAGQDGWTKKTKSTAIEMNRHWKNLISAYITAFDNGKISNVYLSAPYLNIDADNDFPTETVARSARDTTQIVRQNDAMHPGKIGTLKMADVYFANLLYRIPEDNAIYYSITNNLTNVTTNNNVGSVKEGSSYTATLTPADGYVLDSVTVTMGGNPVTVTNGVINISGVTGDIVITATAKVYVPAYTNLAKPSTASSSPNTALTADEWLNGYYISSKKISAKADLVVTNKIPLTFNDTIRIKGFATTGTIGGNSCASRFRVLPCDASGTVLLTEVYPAVANSTQGTGRLEDMDEAELAKGIYCFSPKNDSFSQSYWQNVAFVRICGYPIDGNNANVIVTVNQEITD